MGIMSTTTKSVAKILEVVVDLVRYNADGFSVYTTRIPEKMVIKQGAGPVAVGQRWVVCGKLEKYRSKRGTEEEQFATVFATLAAPTTPLELEYFLLSGLIEG